MVKREPQPVNGTQKIHQEMNVIAIITKLNEVINVMRSFDIEVNLGYIYVIIGQVEEWINFLEDENNGLPMMMKLLISIHGKLENTNKGIKLLSNQYGEVSKSIAMGDEKLTQNIGNLVNQQNVVIKVSNRHLKEIKDRLQQIENKPDPPAIGDIEALILKQSEMRIDGEDRTIQHDSKGHNTSIRCWWLCSSDT